MRKLIYIFLIISIFFVVLYFGQDRMAINLLSTTDETTKMRFSFSQNNHLLSIITPTQKINFILDKEGQKVLKSINGDIIERYFWLGDKRLYLVTDSKNNILREYLYRTKYDVLPYGMKCQEDEYRFVYNKMRSLRLVFDSTDKVVKIINYDEKGERVQETNHELKVDFSYAGGLVESETKLLFFLQGVYNPRSGQWISKIKNDDIIENLKQLTQLANDEVYQCSDTLDMYYHSYLCTNGQCGGLYATDYLNYINGNGYMIDNSAYFNPKRCSPVELPNRDYDKKIFSSCVHNKIVSQETKVFDALRHNCHHEVDEIIKYCTKKSQQEVSL